MAIRGTLPVIPTPFLDGAVDVRSIERLLDHTLPYVDGYTLLGSSGEAPSMTSKERMATTEFVLSLVPPETTIVVGIAHTSVVEAQLLAQHAQEHGAKGVLLPLPFYFVNSPEGAFRFIAEVDKVIDIELVLYDNPVTTKTSLPAQTVVEWAQRLQKLHTVKLTDHDLSKIAVWQRAGLGVLAGDDVILFRYLAAGVDGSMVLAPTLFPTSFKDVWTCVQRGADENAFAIFAEEILPFLHVFGIGDEIATVKALLRHIGLFTSDETRPPLQETTKERRKLLQLAYEYCQNRALQRQAVAKDHQERREMPA